MRNVQNKDLFTIMRIMRKVGIKEKIKHMELPKDENGKVIIDDEQFGVMLIFEVIDSVPEAEDDIFKFLADIAGVTVEEMKEDEFDLMADVINSLKGQKKLVTFLKQAFNSMN